LQLRWFESARSAASQFKFFARRFSSFERSATLDPYTPFICRVTRTVLALTHAHVWARGKFSRTSTMFAHDATRIAPAAHTRAACTIPCSSGFLAGAAGETPEAFPRDYRFRFRGAAVNDLTGPRNRLEARWISRRTNLLGTPQVIENMGPKNYIATQIGVPHEAGFRPLCGAGILPAFFRPATEFKFAGKFDGSRSDTPVTAQQGAFRFFRFSLFTFPIPLPPLKCAPAPSP